MAYIQIDSFPELAFSSQLGDVEVNSDYNEIVFYLSYNSNIIFQTGAQVHDEVATVHDIRSIVEEYMLSLSVGYAEFSMSAEDVERTGYSETTNFGVIYCHHRVLSTISCGDFCRKNFLSTMKSLIVPRSSSAYINFFAKQQEDITAFHQITFSVDGLYPTTKSFSGNKATSTNNSISTEVVTHAVLLGFLQNEGSITDQQKTTTKVMAYTLTVGLRSMSIYFIDEEPDIVFRFRNAFNALECCALKALVTEKTVEEHSEAISNGLLSLYDAKQSTSFEVTIPGLTPGKARWLNQLALSHQVFKMSGNQQRKVLITDVDSEISNDNSKLQELKFTYQYTEELADLDILPMMDDDKDVFTEPYSVPFI